MMNFLCSLALLASLCAPQNLGSLSVLKPSQGGTGIGSATAGDVGKVLTVSDDSPFTFELAAAGGSSNLTFTYPLEEVADVVSLAFGTTTSNTWAGTQTFGNTSAANATTTALDITSLLTFDGVTGNQWSDFCTTITGSPGLCDGTNNTGGASSDNIATSTAETAGQLAYWTSTNATPATLGKVATTSLTANAPLSLSQPISVLGASASTLSISTAGDWTGTLDGLEASAFEQGLTAGDGLTRTGNDFDCDTASGSVFGCLSSTDWTTFNNKLSAAVTAIGPTGQTSDGPTVTFATSSSATNGLTPSLVITGSGDTQTFTSSISGTLTVAGGGTGVATLTGLAKGNGTGAFTAGVDGTDFTLVNAVSCTNQVMTALTAAGVGTCSSINDAYWSGTDLSVANGGTGASTLTGLLQGNGTSAITGVTGTAGQFPYYNGSNTLLATSTITLSTASNIGIGTTTPSRKFSVGGDVVIGAPTAGGTNGNLFLNQLATAAGAFLAVNPSGQVIATTTPSGGGSTQKELWIPLFNKPSAGTFPYGNGVGNYPSANITSTQDVAFTFKVPADYTSTVSISLIVIPDATETLQWDMYTSIASLGEDFNVDDRTVTNATQSVTVNDITALNIAATGGGFTGIAAGDYVAVYFESDTDNIRVLGFRFVYQ